jgi:hypothetical protein
MAIIQNSCTIESCLVKGEQGVSLSRKVVQDYRIYHEVIVSRIESGAA